MKKLMIAAAIVCAATFAQAATGAWGTGWTYWSEIGGQLADDTAGTDEFDGFAYIFTLDADQYAALTSAKTIWDGFHANGADSTLAVAGAVLTAADYGALDMGGYDFANLSTVDFPEGNVYQAIVVTHVGDDGVDAYSANTITAVAGLTDITGASDLALAWSGTTSTANTTWQKVEEPGPEPIPEPFSGTLALLGMGAIALRRKMKKAKKA